MDRGEAAFLLTLVNEALRDRVVAQELTSQEYAELSPRAEVEYSMSMACYMLACIWGQKEHRRAKWVKVEDSTLMTKDGRDFVVEELVGNLDLRGELYFLRLHRFYGDRLDSVSVKRNGDQSVNIVMVLFKNGHVLEEVEANVESTEFLAKCAMVYDL